MSYHYGNPAASAVLQNSVGMAVIASGVVGLASALGDAFDAAREARYQAAYVDALSAAKAHSAKMEAIALKAIEIIAELEIENADLAEACQQRQDVIDRLMQS